MSPVSYLIINITATTSTTTTTSTPKAITENKLDLIREKLLQMQSETSDPKVSILLNMLNETISSPNGKEIKLLNMMMEMIGKLQKQKQVVPVPTTTTNNPVTETNNPVFNTVNGQSRQAFIFEKKYEENFFLSLFFLKN